MVDTQKSVNHDFLLYVIDYQYIYGGVSTMFDFKKCQPSFDYDQDDIGLLGLSGSQWDIGDYGDVVRLRSL